MTYGRKWKQGMLLIALIIVFPSCEVGTGDNPDNQNKCKAIDLQNWGDWIKKTDVVFPTCPQELSSHGQTKDYNAQLTGTPKSQFVPGGSLKVVRHFVVNDTGATVASVITSTWVSALHGDSANNSVQRSYGAGSAPGMTGTDTLYIESETANAGLLQALVRMPYEHKPDMSTSGPVTATPGQSVTINTNVWQYKAPLTYSWKRNGVPLSGTGSSITNNVGSGVGVRIYEVTVTDSEGDFKVKTHSVNVQYPDCPECVLPPPPDTVGTR